MPDTTDRLGAAIDIISGLNCQEPYEDLYQHWIYLLDTVYEGDRAAAREYLVAVFDDSIDDEELDLDLEGDEIDRFLSWAG
jgi:hypothetical protein